MPPKFSLLIHGQDGNIPYLTPELIRLMFPQSNGDEIENGVNTSGGSHGSLRDHLILGVAVKDTCVTPIYRDDVATAGHAKKKEGLKRKRGQNEVEGKSEKWAKSNSEGKAADPSVDSVSVEVTNEMIDPNSEGDGSTSTSKQGNGMNKSHRNEDRVKKPAGYTYFTPASSLKICEDIHSGRILYERERGASISTNLMQAHLRIAPHISTLLVPTFSFVGSCNAGNCGRSDVGVKSESMGYKPKQQEDHVQARKKQKQQPKPPQNGTCIPKSSKDKVSIQTPHGWQVITPGQYINACNSLVVHVSSTSTDKKGTNNEGAVGLFDHVDITPSQISSLLQQECWSKDSDESGDKNVGREDSNNSLMVKQAFKKIGVSVQKTNGWTDQIQSSPTPLSPPLWTPINIFAPQLPKFKVPDDISNSSRVAIVGWDCIPSVQEYRLQRRACLRGVIETIRSSSPTLVNERKFLLLAVNDIQSILDAAREGVSIIGTNIANTWSLSGKALVLDFDTKETSEKAQNRGIIDLNDDKYTRDSLPLLPGCKCLSCRPRNNHHSQRPEGYRHFLRCKIDDNVTPPSFSRAYIHHLLRAKEMLAETLLFAHNLHQLLVLFLKLSSAVRLDDKSSFEPKRYVKTSELESFCQIIEGQVQTSGDE